MRAHGQEAMMWHETCNTVMQSRQKASLTALTGIVATGFRLESGTGRAVLLACRCSIGGRVRARRNERVPRKGSDNLEISKATVVPSGSAGWRRAAVYSFSWTRRSSSYLRSGMERRRGDIAAARAQAVPAGLWAASFQRRSLKRSIRATKRAIRATRNFGQFRQGTLVNTTKPFIDTMTGEC
jgi:hypothetical protein